MMAISRRRFLQIGGVGTVGAVTGFSALLFARPTLKHYLAEPDLPGSATGPLDEATMRVLEATTTALIDMPVEIKHYQDFFRWRSQNVPGYKGLYERFAAAANEASAQSGTPFADGNTAAQRTVLTRCFRAGNAGGELRKARAGLFDREWLLYDRYILREILDLFARTDGWVKIGYETWPGEHRGLYTYTQPPDLTQGPKSGPTKVGPGEDRP
ncbi:MAG: hypothetical protein A2Y76_05020 [Planctomycetes bacterium RBG_13_60_9]|nr:MAG: hypothetical protein A2Y76_05020 [Planctomycetes bacterium RBG_13_60_9]